MRGFYGGYMKLEHTTWIFKAGSKEVLCDSMVNWTMVGWCAWDVPVTFLRVQNGPGAPSEGY